MDEGCSSNESDVGRDADGRGGEGDAGSSGTRLGTGGDASGRGT